MRGPGSRCGPERPIWAFKVCKLSERLQRATQEGGHGMNPLVRLKT
jgi:hypothetical protein